MDAGKVRLHTVRGHPLQLELGEARDEAMSKVDGSHHESVRYTSARAQ